MSQPSSESSSTTALAEKTSTSASSTSPSSASASSSQSPPVPAGAKGRKYEKKSKEYWNKTGQRNVKTIHKTSGRFRGKKEASRDTTGQGGRTGPTPSGGGKKPQPEAKKRRMYLPWE